MIFILGGLDALYQALPTQRENPTFRAIGWWTAAAFMANGAWTYAYTSRQVVLAQVILFAGFVFAGGAYLRFTLAATGTRLTSIDNWIVGPALGFLSGWVTAANVVGLAGTFVALGFVATGQGAAISGAALLVLGGAVAIGVLLSSKRGPEGAWMTFGGAVLWALAAVIVEQRSASALTTGTAAVCAVLVVAAMLGSWRTPEGSSGRLATA